MQQFTRGYVVNPMAQSETKSTNHPWAARPALQLPSRQPSSETASNTPGASAGDARGQCAQRGSSTVMKNMGLYWESMCQMGDPEWV